MRSFNREIICLAKSRKTGGYCFAGKELLEDKSVGQWIRPVSCRKTEEISKYECKYETGYEPKLLDIINISLKTHTPNCFQCENYLIDDEYYWSKKGKFDQENLKEICDYPKVLWKPFNSSYYGLNDRVDERYISELDRSLYSINQTLSKLL